MSTVRTGSLYFEDFNEGEILRHARGKTLTEMVTHQPKGEESKESRRSRALAAVTLVQLGSPDPVWPLLKQFVKQRSCPQ